VAFVVLGDDPFSNAAVTSALHRARRHLPSLGDSGYDVLVVTILGQTVPFGPDVRLVVMTHRPSVNQAACALLLNAHAYLPFDLDPALTAQALHRVAAGRLHIEPETAAALRALVNLVPRLVAHPHVDDIALILALRARGWNWVDAADAVGIDATATARWLQVLLGQVRQLTPPYARTS
jgi:DNA-binding NarL/FixJ family response regulator